MKKEYDFSKAQRGKFYSPDMKLNIPIYFDEDGEKELALIINKAGDEARIRRKKALDAHFDKLNQAIKQAVYLNNNISILK